MLGMEENSEVRNGPQMPQPSIGFLGGDSLLVLLGCLKDPE